MIKSGDLDRRITFQSRTGTQDSATGAYTYSWANLATNPTVWAQVRDVLPSRAESVDADIDMQRRPARIRCRYRSDITSDMRIVYDGRTLRIVSGPVELGRREGLEMIAEEYSTEGEAP